MFQFIKKKNFISFKQFAFQSEISGVGYLTRFIETMREVVDEPNFGSFGNVNHRFFKLQSWIVM